LTRPKPLTPTQRHHLTTLLHTLTNELEATHAPAVQRTLTNEAEIGYPTRTSGTPGNPHNPTDENGHPTQPDTPTEKHALNPDPNALKAQHTLTQLHTLTPTITDILNALQARNPNRTIRTCPTCHHPLPQGTTRCQQTNQDGQRCSTSEDAWPLCRDCQDPVPPGNIRKGRCDACRKSLERHGYTKASAKTYATKFYAAHLTPEGTYHTPDNP